MIQVWHQYVVMLPPHLRDPFRQYLADLGIATDIHYPDPPYLQPCYEEYAHLASPGNPAVRMARSCVSLPIANLSLPQAEAVALAVNNFNCD